MNPDTALFETLLQQEHILAEQLYQLMQQEQQALAAEDLQALQELQPLSADALEQLRLHASNRLQWMQDHDLPHSAACLQHPSMQTAANIHRLWHALDLQYQHNQTLATTLSEVILSARHRTQQKLKILRGQQNDPHLYNVRGQTSRLKQGQGYIQA